MLALFAGLATAEDCQPHQTLAELVDVDYTLQSNRFVKTVTVVAIGDLSASEFENPVLDRVVYSTPPTDGVQEYRLLVTPIDKPARCPKHRVIASDSWYAYDKTDPWIKGIRVYGADTISITKMFETKSKDDVEIVIRSETWIKFIDAINKASVGECDTRIHLDAVSVKILTDILCHVGK